MRLDRIFHFILEHRDQVNQRHHKRLDDREYRRDLGLARGIGDVDSRQRRRQAGHDGIERRVDLGQQCGLGRGSSRVVGVDCRLDDVGQSVLSARSPCLDSG